MSDEAFSPEGGEATTASTEAGLEEAFSAATEESVASEASDEQPAEVTEPVDASESSEAETSTPETYTVKFGDEEVQLTMEELIANNMRQADYTRKTQELAGRRQQLQHAESLWNALSENPKATLEALYQHQAHLWENPQEVDPVQQKLQQHEAFIAEQRDRELEREIGQEIANLQAEVGEFDQDELFIYATENKIPNLRVAYNDMQAVKTRTAESARKEAERVEAKRRQAGLVNAGASRAAGSQQRSTPKVESFEDAWAAAQAELNG